LVNFADRSIVLSQFDLIVLWLSLLGQ